MSIFDGLAYFSMMNIITLYLTINGGMSDIKSGSVVGLFTLLITIFTLLVGSVCDTIGLKKTMVIGIGGMILSRFVLGLYSQNYLLLVGALVLLAISTACLSPIMSTALRRFTYANLRSTGFNIYYMLMNCGACLAGFAVTDGLRNLFGPTNGNLAIMWAGGIFNLICLGIVFFIREGKYCEESERVEPIKLTIGSFFAPFKNIVSIWKEKAFQNLILFLVLTLGVRLVFTHQFLVMPKYYLRVLGETFPLGLANSINPIIIICGLILLIPILNRFDTFKLILSGMIISAFSLVFMAFPHPWLMYFFPTNNSAYLFIIFAQIVIFSFGELMFSPRFTEWISMVSPPEKVASYMSLSSLPMFLAKPLNGMLSGFLLTNYCPANVSEKINTNSLTYWNSPEFMWLIYLMLAILSPIGVWVFRKRLKNEKEKR